jgi:hypothetical protein
MEVRVVALLLPNWPVAQAEARRRHEARVQEQEEEEAVVEALAPAQEAL